MSLTLWKGNRLPILTDTIEVGGSPFDLSGGSVTFSMRPTASGVLKVSAGSATLIAGGTAGGVSYAWGTADTNEVGDYAAWWTYTASGKPQDTPEFNITITEHAPELIPWVNPVDTDGKTSIFQGDAYLAAKNTALVYELELQDMPTLTGGTVTFKVSGQTAITARISDPSTVSVDLTSAQTAVFTTGTWDFSLIANLGGGNTHTILRQKIVVSGSLT